MSIGTHTFRTVRLYFIDLLVRSGIGAIPKLNKWRERLKPVLLKMWRRS